MTAAILVVCLCCGALAAAALRVSPASAMPSAIAGTRLCVGASAQPYLQIGLGWELPRRTLILSSLGPPILHSPYALCGSLPWEIPLISMRGAWVFPP